MQPITKTEDVVDLRLPAFFSVKCFNDLDQILYLY